MAMEENEPNKKKRLGVLVHAKSTLKRIGHRKGSQDASKSDTPKNETLSKPQHDDAFPSGNDANPGSDEEQKTPTKVTDLLLEHLTPDALVVAALSVAVFPTYVNWSDLKVPLSVAVTWLLVAFCAGHKVTRLYEEKSNLPLPVECEPAPIDLLQDESNPQESNFLRRVLARRKQQGGSVRKPISFAQQAWTTLNQNSRRKLHWERQDKINRKLMQQLLQNRRFRRVSKKSVYPPVTGEDGNEEVEKQSSIGSFGLAIADSLDEFVVKPMFQLRGMDVFLTDDPESSVASHPWLVDQGLRDVPTFITNILTQWGNIILYFEMPKWVTDWESLKESDHDTDETIAMKRFLVGTDDYRNKRLKLVPSVVHAPIAVKILAPPKKEFPVHSEGFLPVSWVKHGEEFKGERKLSIALEAELDCVSSKAMRGMAAIVKRNLSSLAIDCAVVIGQPLDKQVEEPQACLGLWRFDHIDVAKCPRLPDRFATEASRRGQSPDTIRASMVVSNN